MHYEVDVNGATRRVELPFVLGVMADLSGQPDQQLEPLDAREFVPVDADTFDTLLAAARPRVMFQVPNHLVDDGSDSSIELTFGCLDDFAPGRVAHRITALHHLLERRSNGGEAAARQIDALVDKQLSAIVHHPSFQRLEATWRSLHRLVTQTEIDDDLKIAVLNVTKLEVGKTLKRYKGAGWDRSPIFKRIHDERYGAAGGEPFACLLLDYEFDHGPADVEMLTQLSKIGAAASVPFLGAAAPRLFSLDSWLELSQPIYLAKIFASPEYAAWRSLREAEDARYLVLTLPRCVVRSRYERRSSVADEYDFHEDAGDGHAGILWGNAAYLFAENILRSFRIHGWPTRINGLQTGGAVEGLPPVSVPRPTGPGHTMVVTETMVPDRREGELAQCGLTALVARGESGLAEFVSAVTLSKPMQHLDSDATANAILASRLASVLSIGRVAHYIRAMARDVSSLGDRATVQAWFEKWIADYVDPSPASPGGLFALPRPLAAAEVTVEDVDGGGHTVKFFCRPNF
ncbi:type VI secretion protein, EvpB/ family [Luteitalea pratensis]|uniref:Type VI secretion protein, EvpB/ family n=2 Tax=Luteitalea pratensis TaxID=1855912 RepID=A0A143PIW8_LUTPR|nr:type VI secretion protein, EvpB/ family [Luteitalea pratensis]